jgi:cyclophilin family peptidyl-prolyl cis-trans isomerase
MKTRFFLVLILGLLMAGCSAQPLENKSISTQGEEQQSKQEENVLQKNATSSPKENLTNEEKNNNMENLQAVTQAVIKTNKGDIKIELDREHAPITVENFLNYVSEGFYDGTVFHRVIKGFMVQGGGFTVDSEQKETKEPIKNEADNGLSNDRGTLAMARTMVVDSATSQFFINLVDNDFLNYKDDANYGYAVFGRVVEGMDVVDEIAKVDTGVNGPHQDWPIEDVVIESVEIVE